MTLDQAGVKSSSGSITVSNDFTINVGSQLTQSANRLTIAGNLDISGTLNHSGGDDIYISGSSKTLSGTGTQTTANYWMVAGSDYNITDNWSINTIETATGGATLSVATTKTLTLANTFYTRTNATITLTGSANMTIGGNAWMAAEAGAVFNLNSGVLDLNGANAHMCGASGTFNANSGTINISSANSTISGTFNEGTSTVNFDGSAQNVPAETYSNLTISNAGTKTASGSIDVNGDFSTAVTATCKLDMLTNDLNVAGDITVGATDGLDVSDASSLLTLDGTADQNVSHAGSSSTQVGYELINHDFESGDDGWTAGGSVGGMSFSRAASPAPFSSDGNATTVWSTSPFNNYGSSDGAYVSSGAIDMTNMTGMTFSIDVRYNTESGWDGAVIFWSTNDFSSMTRLGSNGEGSNWYNNTGVDGPNDRYAEISTDPHGWSGDNTSWETATISLPIGLEGESSVKFRIYFGSDSSTEDDGFAFDNVLITGTNNGGSGAETNNMTINKASGNLILDSEFSVDGTLTFTSGYIDATSNNLVVTENGSFSGADDDSHVLGTIVRTLASTSEADFPLGDGTNLRQVDITPVDGTSRDWTVSYTSSAYGDLTMTGSITDVSSAYYWDISPSAGGENSDVKLSWTSNPGIQDADLTNIKLVHYDGADWEEITTTTSGTINTGSVSGTVTSFSPFSIGTVGANPLPIKLVTFYGEKDGRNNLLRWTTASEKNNEYFTIEKTTDGNTFYEVGRIEGAGNSIYHTSYELTDVNVENALNYYRLVQTDFDGKKEYSKLITIDNRNSEKTERKLIQITNTWGQEINEDYIGIAIYIYSDGSVERVFKN